MKADGGAMTYPLFTNTIAPKNMSESLSLELPETVVVQLPLFDLWGTHAWISPPPQKKKL